MEIISTKNAPGAIGPYSQAMILNGVVYTSGQVALSPKTGEVVGTTIEEQAEQVMKNLGAVLEAAGSSYEKTVKTTCFLADMNDFAAFNEIYGKYFTGKPARSCVEVGALPKGALILPLFLLSELHCAPHSLPLPVTSLWGTAIRHG